MRYTLVALVLVGATAPTFAGTPVPVGPEFQVNTYTTDRQHFPEISRNAVGDFVIVWTSFGSSGSDTSYSSVQGRRYSAIGLPQGPEFQVNSYTTSYQVRPAVSTHADGAFVVVWESFGSGGEDPDRGIRGQRYAPSGAADGTEFQVNSLVGGAQTSPALASDEEGNFVVVWDSYGSSGSDASGYSIQGQRHDSSGLPEGSQFQVNSYTTEGQRFLAIDRDAAGDFVVAWSSAGSSGSDSGSTSVQAQRYGAGGLPLGGEFQVNTYTPLDQQDPAVVVDTGGRLVVVWASAGSASSDTSLSSVQGQRYSAAGPQGGEFQVNTYTTGHQRDPAIAGIADGEFVVVWNGAGSSAGDTSGYSIQGQRFSAVGAPLGSEFQVNGYTTGNQRRPAIASEPDGDFVVVWQSDGSNSGDTSSYSIQGQRFRVTGDLSGQVFFDQDFDGIQNGGEPGIAGITVELYDDTLTLRRAVTTNSNGDYAFKPKEGSWHVRVVRPAAYSFTGRDAGLDDGIDSDVDPNNGESDPFGIEVNIAATPLDAGLTNGIGDKVWNDIDQNGVRDGGELGLPGVTVHLRDKGGSEIASTTTDATGRYHFNGMPPAEYYVDFDALPGFAFSPANQGGDDDADSDANPVTGNSPIFSFALAQVDTSIDAGLFQRPSIAGRVWADADGDGVRESGEPGIDALLVRLLDNTGTTVLASQATSGGGFYAFEGLATASYIVEIVPLGGIDLSPQDVGGDDSIDSDFDPSTARTAVIPFTAGDVVANVDAGLQVVALFIDGFESGDASRWSSAVP